MPSIRDITTARQRGIEADALMEEAGDTDTISELLYQYPDDPIHIFPPPLPLRRKVSFLSSPLSLQRDALS